MIFMHRAAALNILLASIANIIVASGTSAKDISLFKPVLPPKALSNHESRKFDIFNDEEIRKFLPIPMSKYYQAEKNLQAMGSSILPDTKIPSITNDLMDSPIFYFRMPVSAPFIYFSNFDEPPQYPAFTPYNVASAATFPIHPLHLPIPFTSNGKPSHIYKFPQSDITNEKPTTKPKVTTTQKPVVNLNKGPYQFNGKPADIYLLQDSFSSFFENSLNNFYP
ncbi:hypothetical protein V9T40_012284 [Parthenolecanium corni]|uniref:Uncharacterized protein n=1 Tax=Parthenolecanium corni TaxID=536013 RepID=A0AAN9T716_9HEMI